MKSILVLHSFAAYGHMAANIVLPILKAGKLDPTYLPTTLLSTHTAYPSPTIYSQENFVQASLNHFETLDIRFDSILCGYCYSVDLIKLLTDYLRTQPKVLKVVDPVMGDHGKLYSNLSQQHVVAFRELIKEADVITPNLTEALLLADIPYPETQPLTDEIIIELINKLSDLTEAWIVIKGLTESDTTLSNLIIKDRKIVNKFVHPFCPHSFFGSGDLFVSLITLQLLHGIELEVAVENSGNLVIKALDDSLEDANNQLKGIEIYQILAEVYQLVNKK